jgi:hypothetical protein
MSECVASATNACSALGARLYSSSMRHGPSRHSPPGGQPSPARVRLGVRLGGRRPARSCVTTYVRARAVVAAGLAACAAVACARRQEPRPPPPPRADFLIAAGDSTFWVTTGPRGVRVRGSPLVLARYDGKFYEVYVADEDHSFYDAVFTSQRIYRRDLMTGDSVAVFLDSSIVAAARRYGVVHPNESPLGSDEDAADDPSTSVTGEVDIVDVHGPFLSFEYRGTEATKSAETGSGGSGSDHQILRRGVIDLRSGARTTPRALFGAAGGDSAIARGRRAFASTLGAIRAARDNGNERARLAAAASGAFVFDPASFAVVDAARDPGAQFFAPARGPRGGGLTLPLAPVSVPEAADIDWWTAERVALPIGGPDSASDVWSRPGLEVVARYDTAGGPEQGQGVVVLIRQARDARAVALGQPAGRQSAGREWRVGRFPSPTRRLYWLDRPPLDSTARRALVRAFNESALYGDDARTVRRSLAPGWQRPPRIAFVARPHIRVVRRPRPRASAGPRHLPTDHP